MNTIIIPEKHYSFTTLAMYILPIATDVLDESYSMSSDSINPI